MASPNSFYNPNMFDISGLISGLLQMPQRISIADAMAVNEKRDAQELANMINELQLSEGQRRVAEDKTQRDDFGLRLAGKDVDSLTPDDVFGLRLKSAATAGALDDMSSTAETIARFEEARARREEVASGKDRLALSTMGQILEHYPEADRALIAQTLGINPSVAGAFGRADRTSEGLQSQGLNLRSMELAAQLKETFPDASDEYIAAAANVPLSVVQGLGKAKERTAIVDPLKAVIQEQMMQSVGKSATPAIEKQPTVVRKK